MMNENGSKQPKVEDNGPNRKKGSFAIIIAMVLIGTIFIAFLSYQYFIASQSDVPVLEFEVEVEEIGDNVYIKRIETSQSERKMLDAPRTDEQGKVPGIRVKVFKGQIIKSYDSFIDYEGSGTYKIICGFRNVPKDGEILECTVWIFAGKSGSYADDQETLQVIWNFFEANYFLKVNVNANGTYEPGSDANIKSVKVTQEQNERNVDILGFFPGVWSSAKRFNSQASILTSQSYIGGGDYNYTLYLGLFEEPQPGDEFTVTVEIWPRNGEWFEHLYQQPADALSVNYVWS